MKYLIESEKLTIWYSTHRLSKTKPLWRDGRGWMYINNWNWGGEWHFFGRSSTGFDISLGGEEEFKIHLAVYRLFAVWFHLSQVLPRKWSKELYRRYKWWDHSWGREIFGISFHDNHFWLNIFDDPMMWPSGIQWSFDFHKFVWGEGKYECVVEDEGSTGFMMPEGVYNVEWRKERRTWQYRFGKVISRVSFNLKPDRPIPIPGKGENGWDMDDDAIYEGSYKAEALAEAIKKMTDSALETRKKYG